MKEKITLDHFKKLLQENPILYQYSSIDGAKSLLEEMTLLVKNPTKFNDPHDCDIRLLNFKTANKENLKERITKFNSNSKTRTIDYDDLTDDKFKQAYENMALPNFFQTLGVACFSKNFDKSLMWSHYTYSHEGICFGFNLMKLYWSLSSLRPEQLALIEVEYTDNFEPVDFFEQKNDAIYHWIRTKSSIWNYEEEIRILFTNLKFNHHQKMLFEFNKLAISKIILGNRISSENEIWIKSFCKSNLSHIELFKMEKVENSFTLKAEKIGF